MENGSNQDFLKFYTNAELFFVIPFGLLLSIFFGVYLSSRELQTSEIEMTAF
jgi:hypothetical protein